MKKLISLACCILITAGAFALDKKNFSFSVTPEVGFMFGQANEYLDVHDASIGYNHTISRLDYDIAAPYIGVDVDSKLFKWVYLGGSLTYAFYGRSGYCRDYDWMNSIFPYSSYRDLTTHYSISDNYMKYYIDGKLAVGMNIDLPFDINIRPYVSLEYSDLYLDVKNLYYQYGYGRYKYNGETVYYGYDQVYYSGIATGDVGQYRQYYSNIYGSSLAQLGLGLKFNIDSLSFMNIKGTAGVVPFLGLSEYDYHMLRSIDFLSITTTFKFYADLSVSYKINDKNSLGIKGGFHLIPKVDGTLYSKYHSSSSYSEIDKSVETGCAARTIGNVSVIYTLKI